MNNINNEIFDGRLHLVNAVVSIPKDEVCVIRKRIDDHLRDRQTGLYRERGSTKMFTKNIISGMWGEFITRKFLIDNGFPSDVDVDMEVYGIRKKSWIADLVYSAKHPGLPDFQVKTNMVKHDGGLSWVLQVGDPLLTNPDDPTVMVFVTVPDGLLGMGIGKIVAVAPWKTVHSLPKAMVLDKYGNKRAIYLDDMKAMAKVIS